MQRSAQRSIALPRRAATRSPPPLLRQVTLLVVHVLVLLLLLLVLIGRRRIILKETPEPRAAAAPLDEERRPAGIACVLGHKERLRAALAEKVVDPITHGCAQLTTCCTTWASVFYHVIQKQNITFCFWWRFTS